MQPESPPFIGGDADATVRAAREGEGRPAKAPPKSHLRKMQRRVELLREAEEPYLPLMRSKAEGPRRHFARQYDLVMRDIERMLAGMLDE